jgi:SAM-dependent methyltransferase
MGRIFFDPYYQHQAVLPIFTEKLVLMLPALRELQAFLQTHKTNPPIRVTQGDARRIPLDDKTADLIICHPPYFNVYKYSSVYRFEMYWLGFDLRSTQEAEVREAFKVGKPEKVGEYVDDMDAVLREQHRVLRPGRMCGLMIGDTNMKGERICTTAKVLGRAEQVGFTLDRLFVRKPLRTEASYKTALRRTTKDLGANMSDFVVVLRKSA